MPKPCRGGLQVVTVDLLKKCCCRRLRIGSQTECWGGQHVCFLTDEFLKRLRLLDSPLPTYALWGIRSFDLRARGLRLRLKPQGFRRGLQDELDVWDLCSIAARIVTVFWSEIVAKRSVFPKISYVASSKAFIVACMSFRAVFLDDFPARRNAGFRAS